jgi:hypothetical protein
MLARYRQRIDAAVDFWKLSEEDQADLEALYQLYARVVPFQPDYGVWGLRLQKDEQRDTSTRRRVSRSSSSREAQFEDSDSDSTGHDEPASDDDKSEVADPVSWDIGSLILCRTGPEEQEQKFWLAEIIPDQPGDKGASVDNVRVRWYDKVEGKEWHYKPAWKRVDNDNEGKRARGRKARVRRAVMSTDYISRSSVQGNVTLNQSGKVSRDSRRWIEQYVLEHWEDNPLAEEQSQSD